MANIISEVVSSVKVVGANGQISLGKEYAGKQVLVEMREPGVWLVRTAVVIPENELWLHKGQAAHDLDAALAWAAKTPPVETDLEVLIEAVEHGSEAQSKT